MLNITQDQFDDNLPIFEPEQIFIGTEQQIDLFEIYFQRWKKQIFNAQPDDVLITTIPSSHNKIQSLVVLLYGRGGFGKSALLKQYRNLVLQENQNPLFSKTTISDIVD